MITKQEKKALECFAIIVASFLAMMETPESKEDFVKILDAVKKKIAFEKTEKGDKLSYAT